jgi:hypothetical protein
VTYPNHVSVLSDDFHHCLIHTTAREGFTAYLYVTEYIGLRISCIILQNVENCSCLLLILTNVYLFVSYKSFIEKLMSFLRLCGKIRVIFLTVQKNACHLVNCIEKLVSSHQLYRKSCVILSVT